MKPWQNGYEIETLKEFETCFSRWNEFCEADSSKAKKNRIAEMLGKDQCYIGDHVVYFFTDCKVGGPLKAYNDVVIANKKKGDLVIQRFSWDDKVEATKVLSQFEKPTYIYMHMRDEESVRLIKSCKFNYVGSRVSSHGEVIGLFFRHGVNELEPRPFPDISGYEKMGLSQLDIPEIDVAPAIEMLDELGYSFTNHYSNYNKKKAWSALSLRGYLDDPTFITKPSEMKTTWHKQWGNTNFHLQDTSLARQFPEVMNMLSFLDRDKLHRVRLMKLTPGGGTLERHTDQVDKDSGIANDKIARLHIPLKTNPNVEFTVWDFYDKPKTCNMRVGECWYLDTRKPHKAVNNGDSDRIHLVIDVVADANLRNLL